MYNFYLYLILTFTTYYCIIILQRKVVQQLIVKEMKQLREWLIKLRGETSQEDIAKKLGITQQYYSYIETGERQKKMDIQICEKIASIFNISVADIIRYENERA